MPEKLTIDILGRKSHLRNIPAGLYKVEYNDSTHLAPNQWIQLASVNVHPSSMPIEGNKAEQFFTLTKDVANLPASGNNRPAPTTGNRNDAASGQDRRIYVIEDTLSLALGRVGLIAPDVSPELRSQILTLNEQDGVVIIPDTNALHNGAVHWLLRVLHRPSIWLMPVVASLTTIQARDATVKGLVGKANISHLSQALRSRGLVNGALGLFERNRGRCQVIELDPSLLRYQKMSSTSGTDPDQGDVLEDRLIIEAIHGVLRSMRSRTARRVVTSDVNIARVLSAEGIETLFVPTIKAGNDPIDCVRFDALAKQFVGAPLSVTLWELAHAFGTVRLYRDTDEHARFECYWAGKTPSEWSSETLLCEFRTEDADATNVSCSDGARADVAESAVVAANSDPDLQPSEVALPEHAGPDATASGDNDSSVEPDAAQDVYYDVHLPEDTLNQTQAVGDDVGSAHAEPRSILRERSTSSLAQSRGSQISAIIPRASLPQTLRLLGILRRLGTATPERIVAELETDVISADTARRPLEILRRMTLVDQQSGGFRALPDVNIIDAMLRADDLDALSHIFERFTPYAAFRDELRLRGSIHRTDVAELVQSLLGPAGNVESNRLPRFHILLGQAWTDGDWILDGSNRPSDRDATDAVDEAFLDTESVNISKIQNFLLRYCEITHTSPWAAKKKLERLIAARMLTHLSFQPAAGTKPITRDETVAGNLEHIGVNPVIIDRIFLGERPVFTVEGSPA